MSEWRHKSERLGHPHRDTAVLSNALSRENRFNKICIEIFEVIWRAFSPVLALRLLCASLAPKSRHIAASRCRQADQRGPCGG